MSVRRLVLTCAAMAAAAAALAALAPDVDSALRAVAGAQRTVDVHGADALVVAGTGLVAWACWAWAALGLVLTAAAAAHGVLGAAARGLAGVLLPAAARHAAALALGAGLAAPLVLAGPLGSATEGARLGLAAGPTSADVPDWPAGSAGGVPDWPRDPAGPAHVVVPGDCLWDIAEHRLAAGGTPPPDAEVAAAVDGWWATNRAVIGADPDLIHPGQVLRAPPT